MPIKEENIKYELVELQKNSGIKKNENRNKDEFGQSNGWSNEEKI